MAAMKSFNVFKMNPELFEAVMEAKQYKTDIDPPPTRTKNLKERIQFDTTSTYGGHCEVYGVLEIEAVLLTPNVSDTTRDELRRVIIKQIQDPDKLRQAFEKCAQTMDQLDLSTEQCKVIARALLELKAAVELV